MQPSPSAQPDTATPVEPSGQPAEVTGPEGGDKFIPLRVTPENRVALSVLVGFVTVATYSLSNEVAVRLTPTLLPMVSWEQRVPLVPWTFWIYSTVYSIYFTSCFLQRDLARLSRFLNSYVIAYFVAGVFFVVYPTAFPREAYPLAGETGFSAWAMGLFRALDHPTNCLPSMHVASGVMSAAPFYGRRPRVFAAFCLWASAIALTTLTTKQHYFADVLGGIVFGIVVALITYGVNWSALRRPPQQMPRQALGA